MADDPPHAYRGQPVTVRSSRAHRVWVLGLVAIPLIPGMTAAAVGKSPFAAFWITVFTGLGVGLAALLLPSG